MTHTIWTILMIVHVIVITFDLLLLAALERQFGAMNRTEQPGHFYW